MSDCIADVISITTVHLALEQLLATYQSEKEESRRDNDTHFMEYWESACQTIYDVAAALNIPLEEQPSKRRPRKLDSMTDLPTSDVKLTEGSIGSYD